MVLNEFSIAKAREACYNHFMLNQFISQLSVLAKGAVQGTAGKENRSASAKDGDKWLFPNVQARHGRPQLVVLSAKAPLARSSVHPARARALRAVFVV